MINYCGLRFTSSLNLVSEFNCSALCVCMLFICCFSMLIIYAILIIKYFEFHSPVLMLLITNEEYLSRLDNNNDLTEISLSDWKSDKVIEREIMEIADVVQWIEKNLLSHIKVSDVVKISGYGHWYFQKKFKKVAGVNIWNYILKRRLTLAAIDLRDTSQDIADIADKYRWCSQQGFTRSFKSYFGLSPAKWRYKDTVSFEKFQYIINVLE